jgi:hypothetical protein
VKRAIGILKQVRDAISHLNPNQVREEARRPFTIQIFAASQARYEELENWLAPKDATTAAQQNSQSIVKRGSDYSEGTVIRIFDEGLAASPDDFVFRRGYPEQLVCDILEKHSELRLSLARQLRPFRDAVVKDIIMEVSKENAMFSIATSLPDVVPLLSVPWAAGEFVSDTAFLTGNQIRMAFMLAAASDRTIGYAQQKAEIASVFAGAFGWRAIARELVAKIPFGAGVIPKAGISFAATYVVGSSLDRLYRAGHGFSAGERKAAYEAALEKGKEIAAGLLRTFSHEKA